MASLSFEVAQRARFIPGLLRHLLRVGDGRPSLHCGHYKLPSLLVIVLPKPAWGSFIRGNLRLSSGILNPVESAPPGSPPLDCWMKALPGKRLILKVSKMDDQRHWKSQGPNTCQTCFYQVLEDVIRDMYIHSTRCALSPRYATSKTEAAALPRGSGEVGPAARPGPNVIPRIWGGRNGTPAPGFLRLRVAEIRRVMKSDADPPFQDAASLLVIPAGTLLASRNLHCVHCEARPYNPACGN